MSYNLKIVSPFQSFSLLSWVPQEEGDTSSSDRTSPQYISVERAVALQYPYIIR